MSNKAVGVRTTVRRSSRSRKLILALQAPYAEVIFREHVKAPAGQKFLSLFPGLGYAAGYKILQRVYKSVPDSPRSCCVLIPPLL